MHNYTTLQVQDGFHPVPDASVYLLITRQTIQDIERHNPEKCCTSPGENVPSQQKSLAAKSNIHSQVSNNQRDDLATKGTGNVIYALHFIAKN